MNGLFCADYGLKTVFKWGFLRFGRPNRSLRLGGSGDNHLAADFDSAIVIRKLALPAWRNWQTR